MKILRSVQCLLLAVCAGFAADWASLPLRQEVTGVQPMTGIVLWADHERNTTDAIALEFSYMSFASVSPAEGVWNWKPVDSLLDAIASRKHQAVLRFRYEYVAERTTVPAWIQAKAGYQETVGKSEGQDTWFSDWRSEDLKKFSLDFHTAFAARYQDDPRLVFVQVGFGLWAEYHIYEGPMILGRTFPDRAFQAKFLTHLDTVYTRLPWSISIDAANDWAPFDSLPALKSLRFGLFDDSFLHKTHDADNRPNWLYFGADRWKRRMAGGEFSYFSDFDQLHALDAAGMYGRTFESQAARYGISFMIGSDQPSYQTMDRIKAASRATGYRFRAVAFDLGPDSFRLCIKNVGVAPLYRDAYPFLFRDTGKVSLKGLLPGDSLWTKFTANFVTWLPTQPAIFCKHCVAGQVIELEADLSGDAAVIDRRSRARQAGAWIWTTSGWRIQSHQNPGAPDRTVQGRSVPSERNFRAP
ncbi:MAG: DUF4832 domain-containing protein [Fibrobacteres bacterium]|nr:DUF4832 domain-containing protein [Fibrobacterota bacterium]